MITPGTHRRRSTFAAACVAVVTLATAGTISGVGPATGGAQAVEAAPTVTIDQGSTQLDPAHGDTIFFDVVFSRSVTGFDGSDVVIGGNSGADTATVTAIDASHYTVGLSGMTPAMEGAGVSATIPAGAAAAVDDSQLSAASTSTDNGVFWFGRPGPGATVDQASDQPDPTSGSLIVFYLSFDRSVRDVGALQLSGTAGATHQTKTQIGPGPLFKFSVSGMTQSGTVIATAPEGTALGLTDGQASTASTSTDNVVTWIDPAHPVGQSFHPLTPVRILDSRPDPLRVGPSGPWGAGETKDVSVVGGQSGVPATATAVVLNVTATGGTVDGDYLSIWPSGASRPTASSVNFGPGATVANQVTVMVGSGGLHSGKISIFNAGGAADVIIDVNGYYDPTAGDGFTSLSPLRILDSRPPPLRIGPAATWTAGQTQAVTIGGLGGVPADADAVVLNVTATGGTANGNYLSIWPTGAAQPTVSSLNVDAAGTVPNAVTVKLGSGGQHQGKISIFNAGGTQNVILDVVGYFKAGSGKAFYPMAPVRLIDSRPPPSRVGPLGPWSDDLIQFVTIAGASPGVPAGADSVVTNMTVTGGTVNDDYLTIYPVVDGIPTVSSLNADAGQTVANAVTTKLSAVDPYRGQVAIWNAAGTIDVIIDIAGYYA